MRAVPILSLAPRTAPKPPPRKHKPGAGRPKVLDIDWKDKEQRRAYFRAWERAHAFKRKARNEYHRKYRQMQRDRAKAERQRIEALQLACV